MNTAWMNYNYDLHNYASNDVKTDAAAEKAGTSFMAHVENAEQRAMDQNSMEQPYMTRTQEKIQEEALEQAAEEMKNGDAKMMEEPEDEFGVKEYDSKEFEDFDRYQEQIRREQRERHSGDEYWERRRLNEKRLKKYINRLREKKILEKKACEEAYECEQITHQIALSDYAHRKLNDEEAPPSMLVRKKVQPKAAASSYETSFMLKESD